MLRVYWWALLALSVSCTKDIEYFRDHSSALTHVADATYWVEPDSGLDQEKILKAASMLDYMGFTLQPAAYLDADITVRIGSLEECSDSQRIARKAPCGDLTFCGRYLGSVYNVPATYAHELSHALGVDHVPLQCTSDTTIDPSYGPVCGNALMNPESNGRDVEDFTLADAANFLQNRYDSTSIFDKSCSKLKALRQRDAPDSLGSTDVGSALAD